MYCSSMLHVLSITYIGMPDRDRKKNEPPVNKLPLTRELICEKRMTTKTDTRCMILDSRNQSDYQLVQ